MEISLNYYVESYHLTFHSVVLISRYFRMRYIYTSVLLQGINPMNAMYQGSAGMMGGYPGILGPGASPYQMQSSYYGPRSSGVRTCLYLFSTETLFGSIRTLKTARSMNIE